MSILDRAFDVDAIALTYGPGTDSLGVIPSTVDPTLAGGVDAPQGTFLIHADGRTFQKVGPSDTEWKKYQFDIFSRVFFHDDFLATGQSPYINLYNWSIELFGSGSIVEGVDQDGGAVQINAASGNGRFANLLWIKKTLNPAKNIVLEFRGGIDSFQNVWSTLGMFEDGDSHAAYFQFLDNDFFETYTEGPLGNTTVLTTVPLDLAVHDFRIETTASYIKFYIDNILVSTHTTDLPANNMILDFYVEKQNGPGGSPSFFLESVKIEMDR